MSLHSYSRCWLHLVWSTLDREKILAKTVRPPVSRYLSEYAADKGLYMKVNYVNADHVHALIDLPTNLTIENTVQLLKGASSHWINSHDLVNGKFAWGRGYGAFSVFRIERANCVRIHCWSVGTSSTSDVFGGTEGISRTTCTSVAREVSR
jgi:REP element-mobilizing transposase RayT